MKRSFRSGCIALMTLWMWTEHPVQAQEYESWPYCPIVDALPRTAANLEIGIVTREKVQGKKKGSFGLVEERAEAELAFFELDVGSLSFNGILNTWLTLGGELIAVPAQFGEVALRTRADFRTWSGMTFRGDFTPGIYSDLTEFKGGAFAVPFALSVIQTLDPTLAVQGGVRFYPGFHRTWEPLVGVRWTPVESLTLDLFYPESLLALQIDSDWALLTGFSWDRVRDMDLGDSDARKRVRFEESRLFLGVDRSLGEGLLLMVRGGYVLDRRVIFKAGSAGRYNVDDGFFGSVGIGATF
ncbi:MAG: hypothetical protein U1E27_01080 [Kiritimatiellia bacterium]|nr:hypothetical protein [Kiritimatiellia bacterium]